MLEALVNSKAHLAIQIHDNLDTMSHNFTFPARKLLGADSIYELTQAIIECEEQLYSVKHQVPQTMMAIAEVLNYLES